VQEVAQGKVDCCPGDSSLRIFKLVQEWIKESKLFQLHDEMFCAGYKDGQHDACLGDSGGPLVINFEGRWTLIGITSAGFGCAVEKQPGIYHKVSKTASWISKQISQP
jgi:secreted trypsin-like serine protease